MSNYPERFIVNKVTTTRGGETWEEQERTAGVVRSRYVVAGPWFESSRTDCFCCSCSEDDRDAHCRNHGFDGKRPCELHNQPGELGLAGHMPASIERHSDDVS